MTSRFALSRRTVLRSALQGVGAAVVGLPCLEAMLNVNGTAYAAGGSLPKRFGTFFWGNGIDANRWVPRDIGAGYTLSAELAPLAAVKNYVSVVSGTRLTHIRGNAHLNCATGILTGDDHLANTNDPGSDYTIATVNRASIDQVVAGVIKGSTPYSSLQITSTPEHGGGTGIGYISHNGPYSENKGERSPANLFNRLFGANFVPPGGTSVENPRNLLRRSILDGVTTDAARLRARLGKADQSRLDQHLTGVRALEQRITAAPPDVVAANCVKPAAPGSANSMREHTRLMADLLAMAFACDLSRVVAYQFSSPASHVTYPDVGYTGDVHEDGHTRGITDEISGVYTFIVEQFATVLTALKNMPEGAGNVLDNSAFMATSCIAYGPSHGTEDYPLLVAGGAGGALKTPGVHVRLSGENATRVPFTVMRAVGLTHSSWGYGPHATNQVISELIA